MTELSKKARSAYRWYVLACSMLGVGIGYFVGSSQSPVVTVLLPLLFGLLGGAGTFHMLQMDATSETSVDRHRYLAKAMVLFVILCFVGTAYGALVRTGATVSKLLPMQIFIKQKSNLPGLDESSLHEAMELVLIRARLQALGVSPDELKNILRKASAVFGASRWDESVERMLKSVVDEGKKTLNELKIEAEREEAKRAENVPSSVRKDMDDIRMFINLNVDWINASQKRRGLPVADIAVNYRLYEELFSPLRRGERLQQDSAWWASHPKALFSLLSLMTKIQDVTRELDSAALQSSYKDIDGLLKIIYGAGRSEFAPWVEQRPVAKAVERYQFERKE